MKTVLNRLSVALLFMGLFVLLVSCEPKPQGDQDGQNGNLRGVERRIVDDIRPLQNETNWEEAQKKYSQIKSDIGNKTFNLKPRVQKDLNNLADKAFCNSMDTIMYIIMTGECKSRHSELFAIHKRRSESDEFSKVTVSSLHVQVEDMFANHENMRKKIVPDLKKSKQNVTSFETPYAEKYEKEAAKSAAAYLEKNPTCKEIKDGLTSVKDGKCFDGWRKSYCQKVVDNYCEQFSEPTSNWAKKYENITIGNIGFYTNKHPSDPKVIEWQQRIADVRMLQQSAQ